MTSRNKLKYHTIHKQTKTEEINYSSKIENCTTFEKNNPTIALNFLYTKQKEICPAYISKINSNCGMQIILLMFKTEKKNDGIILL